VLVDETRLRQVLINLLGNAIKFTQKGSVTLQVSESESRIGDISADSEHRHISLLFQVRDTGIGISSEDFEKVFQSFEQVGDYKKNSEGTGLGLSISQRIIRMMGGEIQVRSELGHGSEFFFELSLPILPASSLPKEEGALQRGAYPTGYEGERRSILVVDDQKNNRDVLLHLLSPLGFIILEAENGQDGLESYLRHDPDLIIADIVMPVMDCYEMIQCIRKHEAGAPTHIIVSSASTTLQDQQQAIRAGGNSIIAKPIEALHLLGQIGQALNLIWRFENEQSSVLQINTDSANNTDILPSQEFLKTLLEFANRGRLRNFCQSLENLQLEDAKYSGFVQPLLELGHQYQLDEIERTIGEYLKV
jgi:CheY-like chemotaxis protein